MEKKWKTAKELGLPKGFTLSNHNREMVIRAAGESIFGEETNTLVKEEFELFEAILAHIYPQEKREEYEKLVKEAHSVFRGTEHIVLDTYRVESGIIIDANGEEIRVGRAGRWNSVSEAKERGYCTLPTADIPSNSWNLPRLCEAELSADEIFDLLDQDLRERLLEFHRKVTDLSGRATEFRTKVRNILWNYTSTIKLCNTFPEFIGWIRLAKGLEEDPGRCSDIPLADDMQDIRKLAGK